MFVRVTLSLILTLTLASSHLSAALLVDEIGNTSPGFFDGDFPTALQVQNAQNGQLAPFDQTIGNDIGGPNLTGTWTLTPTVGADDINDRLALGETIAAITFSLGIVGHESANGGDQVALFTIDGQIFTAALNTSFNNNAGAENEYNIYSLNLNIADPILIANLLADNSLQFSIELQNSFEGVFNGGNLIFSRLGIITNDPVIEAIPEPSTMLLLSGVGLFGLARRYRRRKPEGQDDPAEV